MQLRFERRVHSPHPKDVLLRRLHLHLALQGYRCVERESPLVFRRGSRAGSFLSMNVENIPHEITLSIHEAEQGVDLNVVYEVDARFQLLTELEMDYWEREQDELEAAILGEAQLPMEVTAPRLAFKAKWVKILAYSIGLAASFFCSLLLGTWTARSVIRSLSPAMGRKLLVPTHLGLCFLFYAVGLVAAFFIIRKILFNKERLAGRVRR